MSRSLTLACVFAHPDDDAYGVAGSVALHADDPDLVARILDEEDPAVVVTFGPDGIFGHPDHIAIGAATDEAFARLRSGNRSGFQRLVHGAVPQSAFERWNRQHAELGLNTLSRRRRRPREPVPAPR